MLSIQIESDSLGQSLVSVCSCVSKLKELDMRKNFYVRACWDEEAKVYYSESDIRGLHIEAETIEKFQHLMQDLAPDLIIENHLDKAELTGSPLRDIIPSYQWEAPARLACA